MQKSLGITALVVAVLALIVPVAGPYMTLLVALLAAFAAGEGKTLGAAAILISLVNIVFLSPSLWITEGLNALAGEVSGQEMSSVMWFLICVQLIAAAVLFVMERRRKREPTPALT